MKGFHHAYLGLATMIVGFLLIWALWPAALAVMAIGFYVFADDVYQHIRQRREPEYQSPLHRMHDYLYRNSSFIRRLNAWADKLFGG